MSFGYRDHGRVELTRSSLDVDEIGFFIPIPVDRDTHFCSRARTVIYVPGWHCGIFPHTCQSVIIVVFIESYGISDGIF